MRGLASLTFALCLTAVASGVVAQETPLLGPEVTSVLGEPAGEQAGLDMDVLAVLGPPEGAAPPGNRVDARAKAIDYKLRCPVCQGVAIADSPSGMATNMRAQVRDLVAKGYSEEQILTYFERSYGEFVRLEPPLRGLNWMLWVLPGIALLGGALFVFRMARQKATPVPSGSSAVAPAAPVGPAGPAGPVDPDLAQYLERIRRDSGTTS